MESDREAYWLALEQGSRFEALAAVRRLRAARPDLDALDLLREVVVPAQARVDALWESGAWSGDQRRVATAVGEGLAHWLSSFSTDPPADRPLVVVACMLGEEQALPAVVLGEELVAAGVRVHPTGGSPDPAALLRRVLSSAPRAVLLHGGSTSLLAQQVDLLEALAAAGVPVLLGGRALGGDERRATALGATALADDAAGVLDLLGVLPTRLPARSVEVPSPARLEARWILDVRPEITPYVVRALAGSAARTHGVGAVAPWAAELGEHVDHLLGCLAATLVTDDPTIMVEVAEWLERVLTARGAPAGLAARTWAMVTEPLRGHPLAQVHLAGAAPGRGATGLGPPTRGDGELGATA